MGSCRSRTYSFTGSSECTSSPSPPTSTMTPLGNLTDIAIIRFHLQGVQQGVPGGEESPTARESWSSLQENLNNDQVLSSIPALIDRWMSSSHLILANGRSVLEVAQMSFSLSVPRIKIYSFIIRSCLSFGCV